MFEVLYFSNSSAGSFPWYGNAPGWQTGGVYVQGSVYGWGLWDGSIWVWEAQEVPVFKQNSCGLGGEIAGKPGIVPGAVGGSA